MRFSVRDLTSKEKEKGKGSNNFSRLKGEGS